MAQLAMLGGMGGGGLMSLIMPMFASVIGMFMQPGQKEEQGKLNDLKVSTSAYGQGIAIVYGTMRVPGNMFWATEFEEEKRYINSKGKDVTDKKKGEKKGQPVYEYYANYAMGLCEGPVGEVLRIWADSNLIYDKYNPDNEDLVGPGFSQPEESGGKMGKGAGTGKKGGSQESGRFHFRFYNGSEGQLPDPHMASKNTEFNDTATPAHRGLCYLYFERFALADFGNRIPTITAEVASEHFRKPVFTYFKVLEQLGDLKEWQPSTTSQFGNLFFDPVHLRAYTIGGGVIRAWDLTTKEETDRIAISDIKGTAVIQVDHPNYDPWNSTYYSGQLKLFNGIAGVNYATSGVDVTAAEVIGISASGDLICTLAYGAQNSRPIGFIDPNTWVIKSRFGEFGNQLANSSISLQYAVKSTVLTGFDPLLKIPIYYTAIQSQFGDIYFFNDKNEPMGYYTFGGSIYSPQAGGIAPGLPSSSGTTFYIMSPTVLFEKPGARLYRFDMVSGVGSFLQKPHRMMGLQVNDNSMLVEPQRIQTIYDSAPQDDEISRSMTMPYPIVGSEAVCFIEFVTGNTVHPEKNGSWAVKIDYGENDHGEYEVLWRERISTSTFIPSLNDCTDSVILTGHRLIYRFSDTLVWDIDFSLENIDMWYLPADAPDHNATQFYFPTKGCIYQESSGVPSEWMGIPTIVEAFLDKMIQKEVTPAEILRDLAGRVGIGADRVDTTKLNDDKITGYVVQQPKAARRVADDLMKVFFFDVVESDYMLKAVSRSQSTSVVTVTQPDLGYIGGNTPADNAADFYKETRVQEIDLPQTVIVSYIDAKEDYETGSQHWRRPRSPLPVMQSRETLDINVPMAMQADFAKQTAQKIVYSAWSERSNYEFALPWKYIKYDPTDVMTFVMEDGLTFQARMANMDLGQDFSIRAHGVATEMASYDSDVAAQRGGGVIPIQKFPAPHVRGVVFDIPYFEDTDSIGDNGWNFYWGLRAYGPGFRFGTMSSKALPSGQWQGMGVAGFDLVWGSMINVIPPPPNYLVDSTDHDTIIRAMPAFDFDANQGMYEWASIPDEEWPSHDNTLVVGEEIIYFKNVEANGDGSYNLSHLIRGARGTRAAAFRHRAGEVWVIKTRALLDDAEDFADAGSDYLFRPAAPATFPAGLPVVETKMMGASHRPWSPSDIRRANSGPNIVFTWQRETRLGGTLRSGTGTVPNVEGVEEYEFYILYDRFETTNFDPDNPSTYRRKYGPLQSPTVTYTSADLAADGLTQNSILHVAVIQRNAFVGRGFVGWNTFIP